MPQTADPLAQRYATIRDATVCLAAGLSAEDCQAQSMPDTSPVKWHLAHTTWFFETFVLEHAEAGFVPFDPAFRALFNSYYNAVGDKHPRPQRGLLTRPDLRAVQAYRHQVDARMAALLQTGPADEVCRLVELGLQHEQQHQELILTDLKHLLSCNPIAPSYRTAPTHGTSSEVTLRPVELAGGLVEIGHAGDGFAFDNESPRHRVFLEPYALSNRLVTQGEWLHFVDDGGYRDPRWWLSAGWDWVQANAVSAPLYWRRRGSAWSIFTLRGEQPLSPGTPALHLSCYEADAYCRWLAAHDTAWADARLPTEAEWEHAAAAGEAAAIQAGTFAEAGTLAPSSACAKVDGLQQMFGEAWQWTSSSYGAYPGYRPWAGAVGEYNGKFMINQQVLRGGSFATPRTHIRACYRNFFPADARWQFSGLRLARSTST